LLHNVLSKHGGVIQLALLYTFLQLKLDVSVNRKMFNIAKIA